MSEEKLGVLFHRKPISELKVGQSIAIDMHGISAVVEKIEFDKGKYTIWYTLSGKAKKISTKETSILIEIF